MRADERERVAAVRPVSILNSIDRLCVPTLRLREGLLPILDRVWRRRWRTLVPTSAHI